MPTTVNFYNQTADRVVRTRDYATRELAWTAIKRAQSKRQIAAFAGVRTATDR